MFKVGDRVRITSTLSTEYGEGYLTVNDEMIKNAGKIGTVTEVDDDSTLKLDIDPHHWYAFDWIEKLSLQVDGAKCFSIPETNLVKGDHYREGEIETIDVIESTGALEGFCIGNIIKYAMRLGKKDDVQSELFKIENYAHKLRTGEWLK